ncbi:ECF transporter S component [Mycoplasma sp. CSL7503-lung]|uniref:ECF transporter S component n=1 Tax=Mycoplasma sp. CSL7503-lung TaxID=536372 RepID=UPI0021D1DAF0|nr:ECF transporter S component [Mycoplasma sp. CSL7503-lung]MCU4706640.1 ECF transporter S component [Mycoplasma sp. CSL7503-lung]
MKTTNNNIETSFKKFSLFPKWTIKKMVFVAILIAISVSFTIIVAQLVPIVNLPTYKFSFIGLPVKVSGFIFGPMVGLFVGIVSDFLSLLFIPPAGYNPFYTLATAINGLISGIFGFYFISIIKTAYSKEYLIQKTMRKINLLSIKYHEAKLKNNDIFAEKIALKILELNSRKKYVASENALQYQKNIYLFVSILLIILVIAINTLVVLNMPEKVIDNGIIQNKYWLIGIMNAGFVLMILFIFIGRFTMNTNTYLNIVPIIVFSAFLELINVPVLSYADLLSLGSGDIKDIFIWISQHILSSPIKIWFNTFVIFFTYSVISKLVNKNEDLVY